ncbi:MAG: hypothetical protein RL240_2043 [Planctomycetota bacterium]|jgi:hypothetical protein
MHKRYQVFLSSTFLDLEEERKEVMAALQKAGYLVVGMELFPSDTDESWEVIKRVIDQSDYYVLVVGGRYGSIGKEGKSYTEMEYDYANEHGLPVLAFLHKNPENLPNKHVEKSNLDKLNEFRSRIETRHNRRTWLTKHELATDVLASISQTVYLRPRVGWVRGDIADDNFALSKKIEDLRVAHEAIRAERDSLAKRIGELEVDSCKQLIAWGDDEIEVAIDVTEKGSKKKLEEVALTIKWNRIFDLVAPKLIGWCSVYNATRDLTSMLRNEISRQASTTIHQTEFGEITEDSLDMIRNQLLAIEFLLVEKERVKDEFAGRSWSREIEKWRLSERGLREYAQKKARRRDP